MADRAIRAISITRRAERCGEACVLIQPRSRSVIDVEPLNEGVGVGALLSSPSFLPRSPSFLALLGWPMPSS